MGSHFLDALRGTVKSTALPHAAIEGVESWAVRPLSRQPRDGFILGDLLSPASLKAFVVRDSAIVHLAYSRGNDNVAAARNLAMAAIEGRARRFVHVSTAVVVGRSGSEEIDESTPCAPSNVYEREKLEIEAVLQETLKGRVSLCILRPTAVFGSGGKNLASLAQHIASSSRFLIALRMAVMGHREMNLVAVENVIAAIAHVLMRRADDGPFIVTDDHVAGNQYIHVVQRLMEGMGMSPVAPWLDLSFGLRLLLRMAGRPLSNPRTRFLTTRLRASGYRPVADFDEAVRRYGAWFAAARGRQVG